MNSDLREGLEKFLAWYLGEIKQNNLPLDADYLRQAFLDELGERIDQFDSDQDWDKIFSELTSNLEMIE
jgi:hypothetical protein